MMNDQTTDEQKTAWLRNSVLADELDASEVETLARIMGSERLAGHEWLVSEGDARRTLFVLVAGRLDVLHHHEGVDSTVYRMSPGECAGTRAFVDGSPRKAGLRAARETVVLTLEPEDFEALLADHPTLVFKVMRALFRITHTNLMRANQERDSLHNYVTRSHGRY
ncbi:MAG: cyclic nucleotide-binding domain-containing protein [Halochromatium sp.]